MKDCYSESQIKNFYAGMCTEEESRAIRSHLYGCAACTALYVRAVEDNLMPLPYDLVQPVMAKIKRPAMPKRRLLSIYAIAACATLLIVGSGSMEAVMNASQLIGHTTRRWSQKLEDHRFDEEGDQFKVEIKDPKSGGFLEKIFKLGD